MAPAPWRFPARNRIVGGSLAAVVVEARERSGALITADLALEEGREVFAVPGEITSALSAGSNGLLRLGATPLTAAQDVLESYGIAVAAAEPVEVGPSAAAVLEAIRAGAAGADELSPCDRALPRASWRRRSPNSSWQAPWREEDGVYRLPASIAAWPTPSGSPRPLRPCGLGQPGPADVEIVGGGVTGMLVRRSRSRALGQRVRLHEARAVAAGASGRNGGFALRGGAMAYDGAREWLGHDGAADYWRAHGGVPSNEWPSSAGTRSNPRGAFGSPPATKSGRAPRRSSRRCARTGSLPSGATSCPSRSLGRFPGAVVNPDDGVDAAGGWVRRLAVRRSRPASRSASTTGSRIWVSSRPARVVIAADGLTEAILPLSSGAGSSVRSAVRCSRVKPIPERLYLGAALRPPGVRLLAAASRRPPRRGGQARHELRDRGDGCGGDDPGHADAGSTSIV